MKIINKVLAAAILAGGATMANASDVLITPTSNGKETIVNFDFANDNNAVGLQFKIGLQGVSEKALDLSGCNGSLGKAHVTGCSFHNETLTFIVYGVANDELPTTSLGSIRVNAPIGAINQIQPKALEVALPRGRQAAGELLMDLQFVEAQLNAKQMSEFTVK